MRTSARKTGTAAAAATAALLLLAGCGGGSSDGGKPSPSAAGGGTHESSSGGGASGGDSGGKDAGSGGGHEKGDAPDDGGSGGGSGLEPNNLSGGWTTGPEGEADQVVFLIISGKQAIVASGTSSCTGSVARQAEPVTFDLDCQGGDDDYSKGTVASHQGKKLVVAWKSGKKSTFTKGGGPGDFPTPGTAAG